MKVYKVVRPSWNLKHSWQSCSVSDSKWMVHYDLNKFTMPNVKGSRLFVFLNLSDAQYFQDMHGGTIFEAEALGVTKPLLETDGIWDKANRWKEFNKLLSRHKKTKLIGNFPAGTALAKAVKLVKKI